MNILFMGTASFACPSLEALVIAGSHPLIGVVTQPDRPSGRRLRLTPSPVKTLALQHGLPVYQPPRIREPSFVETIRRLQPSLIVVVAYGQILPREILQLPHCGCVNLHASLLPRHRGASPVAAALLHGDTETGVTTFFMDEGMDTGDIILQERIPIAPDDTGETLEQRLAPAGARLLLRTVELIAQGRAPRIPQDPALATTCKKLTKEDGHLDWRLPARQLLNRVRAFTPWPGAFCFVPTPAGSKRLRIWAADVAPHDTRPPGTVVRSDRDGIVVATAEDALRIRELQLEGGRRLPAGEFLLGHPLPAGTVLT